MYYIVKHTTTMWLSDSCYWYIYPRLIKNYVHTILIIKFLYHYIHNHWKIKIWCPSSVHEWIKNVVYPSMEYHSSKKKKILIHKWHRWNSKSFCFLKKKDDKEHILCNCYSFFTWNSRKIITMVKKSGLVVWGAYIQWFWLHSNSYLKIYMPIAFEL